MPKHAPEETIAFQGSPGAHSDMACHIAHPYLETLPCASFEAALNAVEEGQAKYAMIPIENSQAGRVAEIHNLLPHTNLFIIGEYFHRVHHQLIGIKGAKKEAIKSVISHPQALMQCRNYLKSAGITAEPFTDTASAVEEIARLQDSTKGAIASDLAAALSDLDVIDHNIEDADNNTTLFVTFAGEPVDIEPGTKDPVLTTILFTTRNLPSGLYKVLGGFATNDVNLVKLESYIPDYSTGEAQFFATFEGHPDQDNVAHAMEEVGFFTKHLKVLGVYPADPARYR